MTTALSPKFRTSTGRLTAYSFGCGYLETKATALSHGIETTIWHEGACYHVRQFDYSPNATSFRVFWESFDTLNEARNLFNRQPGFLTTTRSYPSKV